MSDTSKTGAKAKAPAKSTRSKVVVRKTKSDKLIALLSRPEGATIAAMMKASGWQAHSVRGYLAGTLKKKLGHAVISEKTDDVRIYRIAGASA